MIEQCPICKHPVHKDETDCSFCGYTLIICCLGCTHPNSASHDYCSNCGRPLKADEVAPDYQDLFNVNEKNRDQLIKYADDVTKLYMWQRQLEKYLPAGLLDKLLLADDTLVSERRYVTVLFSDVVGFTRLSADLDPEEVFVLMNKCFRLLVEQVYKYGGTVDKFIGDGMMALFGAPHFLWQ